MKKKRLAALVFLILLASACGEFSQSPIKVGYHVSEPVLHGQNLYFGAGYCLYRLNVNDQALDKMICTQNWTFQSLAVDDERVYSLVIISPGAEQFIVAVDLSNNEIVWQENKQALKPGKIFGGSVLIEDKLVVSQGGKIYVFDSASGKRLGRGKRIDGVGPIPFVVHDNLVWYIAGEPGEVKAIDPVTGRISINIDAQPNAEFDQLLYVGEERIIGLDSRENDLVFAVDRMQTNSTTYVWSTELVLSKWASAPVSHEELLVFERGSAAYAVDTNTGYLEWVFDFNDDKSADSLVRHIEKIGIFNHRHFHNSVMYALDITTGTKVWKTDPPDPVQVLVAEDIVYIVCKDSVSALDIKTGKTMWEVSIDSEYRFSSDSI